jgi:transcriptional regulator with XRE-family HTH domain
MCTRYDPFVPNFVTAYNLKRIRKACGFSQAYVGKILDISYQAYQKYETGKSDISAKKLFTLSLLFHCDMKDFFDYSNLSAEDMHLSSLLPEDLKLSAYA